MSQKFKSEVELEALNNATADTDKFLVSDGGIIKYRTGAEVRTDIGADSVSVVKHQVKAGVAINKGQAVYVTSADGTNMIVGLASNASEATSSKTMGLLDSTVAINGFANVVAEGLLAGLDTSTAAAGDPVWLGTNGNLIYGLVNKPYAPAHLVFIGIVTRVNSSNGEIFVKVQNGFELNEIHDIDLKTTTPVNGHLLGFDGTLWVNKTIASWLGYTPAPASGSGNYIQNQISSAQSASMWISGNAIVNGSISIGTTSQAMPLQVKKDQTSDTAIVVSNAGTASATTTMSFVLQEVGTPQGWFRRYRDGSGLNEIGFSTDLAFSGSVTGTKLERMRITSAGNVGIGTSAPSFKFNVVTDAIAGRQNLAAIDRTTSNFVTFTNPQYSVDASMGLMLRVFPQSDSRQGAGIIASGGALNGETDLSLFVSSGTTSSVSYSALNIKGDSGNVGIGTTSPSEKLHVVSTSAGLETFPIAVQNASASINTKVGIKFSPSGGTTRYSAVQGIQEDGNNLIGLGFITGTGATITEKMRILANGNVGIGTTGPSLLLQVGTRAGIGNDGVVFWGQSLTGSNRGYLSWDTDVASVNAISNLVFRTNTSSERMRITSTGNVGIGTTSPTARLHVANGDILANQDVAKVSLGAQSASGDVHFGSSGLAAPAIGSQDYGFYAAHNAYRDSTGAWKHSRTATIPSVRLLGSGGVSSGLAGFNFAYSANVGTADIVWTNLMQILPSGNVGIGTTSPDSKLTSLGNIKIGNALDNSSQWIGKSNSGTEAFRSAIKFSSTTTDDIIQFNTHRSGVSSDIRMTIDGIGNVGIGTTSPSAKLQVIGTAGKLYIDDSGVGYNYYDASNAHNFRDFSGASKMYINTSTGNVGIGTTSPLARLNVLNSSSTTGALIGGGTATPAWVQIGTVNSGVVPFIQGINNGLSSNVNLSINPSGGNVGIGTTSPIGKLDVVGDAAGGTLLGGRFSNITANAAGVKTRIELPVFNGTSGGVIEEIGNSIDGYRLNIYQSQAAGVLTFGTAGDNERMRITNTGNVGIGTSSPGGRLHVVGTSGSIFVDTSNTFALSVGAASATPNIVAIGTSGTGVPQIQGYTNGFAATTNLAIQPNGGNLGIGTTSPGARLDVVGVFDALPARILRQATYGEILRIGRNGVSETASINYPADGVFAINTSGSERMRINASGNVGIGTTSPTVALQVGDTTSGTDIYIKVIGNNTDNTYDVFRGERRYPRFTLKDTVSGGSEFNFWNLGNQMRFGTNTGTIETAAFVVFSGANGNSQFGGNFAFTNNASKTISINSTLTDVAGRDLTISAGATVAGTATPNLAGGVLTLRSGLGTGTGASTIQFQTGTTLTTGLTLQTMSTKMTILGNGNVGIGTTNPATKLHIEGTTVSYGQARLINTSASGEASINIGRSNQTAEQRWTVGQGTAGIVDSFGFYTSGSNRMVITPAGNVGIGTTSPSVNLEVKSVSSTPASIRANQDLGILAAYIDVVADATVGGIINVSDSYNTVFKRGLNESMRIDSLGNVGIGNSSPGALLDVSGDALINRLTIGRGGGNSITNTALGLGTLDSNTTGEYNIAVGASANTSNNISGSTVIGVDLFTNPSGVSGLTSNSIAISQYNPDFTGTQYPHIYAPDKILCPNGNVTTDVLAIDYGIYTAAFIEYSIFNSAGDEFRAGTYTVAFKGVTGTPVEDDNQTVVYSGTTLSATFMVSISLAGSVATIQLRNQDSDNYYIRFTSRLIMR